MESFDISDEDDFREVLRALLIDAQKKGIEVTGGWSVSQDSGHSKSWDVEITSLSRQTTFQASETEGFPLDSVLSAVAKREGVDETDLPPLQDSIDVDSLERVLSDLTDEMPGEVTFNYCGYTITVHADGLIKLEG
jgi:hypothetical protein